VPATPARSALLGAVCVSMAANRPPDALIAGAILLFAGWRRRRDIPWLAAGIVAPLAALLFYNLAFIGHIAGGYGLEMPKDGHSFFQLGWSGVPGLLISPTRGLLVFSPFLAFVPVGLARRLRAPETRWLAVALSCAVAGQILLYSQVDWRGGVSWGPRWLTNMLPILVWMLAPAPPDLRPLARGALVLTMGASIAVQAIGAFWYTKTSDERIFAGGPAPMSAAWDFGNIPFLTELRHPPARGELACGVRSVLDRIGPTLAPGSGTMPGVEAGTVLEGWALACGRAPAQLLVLIDGIVIGSAVDFVPREDVSAAMQTAAPSGWRIVANTLGVAPGERVLQLAVRIEPRSDLRIISEQRVLVSAPAEPPAVAPATDLESMAARAAALLRERQAEPGFWVTSYTHGLRYEAPQQEMNTFLTALLADTLAPDASQHGLEQAVERARQHLAAQIESDGLVRYHGLPDAPTIGTLGCVITPDADDTALAWRIAGAGAGDPRQRPMLDELARYRDEQGLYRTWLAPQERYQCIDPGSDPNPADAVIQMHVYLMLREFDPPAAQNLCAALGRSFEDERIWVYYANTPLVPYLRSAELRRLGCPIPLPAERLARPVAGQELWSEAVRWLAEPGEPDEAARQAMRQLLLRIGSDDFAALRRSPPLLYHNDLSATVRRFYWSEDAGYALWLRLYDRAGVAAEHPRPPSR
ncbi:MAG TPA: hypothetical protein VGE07_15710, partial [Herpetosiphonaceae bacterium]